MHRDSRESEPMVPGLKAKAARLPASPGSGGPAAGLSDRACKRLAGGLIGASVVFHLAYLVANCPLDLSPDEAHYWQWSRHLAWSYYSKGPLVAWLIRLSCELFGGLSDVLVGSPMLAVRLPAVACHAALLSGWYVLAHATLKSHRAALATVALALTLPAVSAGAVLMTIDPPFLACWCWALVGVWKGLEAGRQPTPNPSLQGGEQKPSRTKSEIDVRDAMPSELPLPAGRGGGGGSALRFWLLAAVCSAFGVLAKYPMVLLPCAVFGYLLFNRRAELKRPGFWVFAVGSAVGLIPVFAWNAANGWVTFKHVGTQAAGGSGTGVRWLGPLAFAAGQAGFLIGVWFVAWAAAAWKYCRSADPAIRFLWWTSVSVWGVFAVASFKASGQVNWPAAAYVGGFVLCVAWAREQLNGRYRKPVTRLVGVGVVVGVTLSVLVHFPALMRPALASVSSPAVEPTEKGNPTPIRRFDPTARLRGWRTLGKEVDAIRARVRAEEGAEPLVAGTVWNVPGALGVYCDGHPETYSFGLAMADRHSQYDVWRPNPVADAQAFRGRTFVFVGDGLPAGTEVFERVELAKIVVYREAGVPVSVWWVWVGHGFRGFPEARAVPGGPRY